MEKYKVIKQRAAALVLSASMLASLVGCAEKEEQKGEINELAQEVVATTMKNAEESHQFAKDMVIEDFLAEYGMDKDEFENLVTKEKNKSANLSSERFQVPKGATKTGEEADKVINDILDDINKIYHSDEDAIKSISRDIEAYKNDPNTYREGILYDICLSVIYDCISDGWDGYNSDLYYFNNCGMFEGWTNQVIVFRKVRAFDKYIMYSSVNSGDYLIVDHNNKLIASINDSSSGPIILDDYNVKLELLKSLLSSLGIDNKGAKVSDEFELAALLFEVNSKLNGEIEEKSTIPANDVCILSTYYSDETSVVNERPKYSVLVKDAPNLFNMGYYVFSDVLNSNARVDVNAYLYTEYAETRGKYYDFTAGQFWEFYASAYVTVRDDKIMPLNVFLKENGYEDLIKEEYSKEELQDIAGYLNQQYKLSRIK